MQGPGQGRGGCESVCLLVWGIGEAQRGSACIQACSSTLLSFLSGLKNWGRCGLGGRVGAWLIPYTPGEAQGRVAAFGGEAAGGWCCCKAMGTGQLGIGTRNRTRSRTRTQTQTQTRWWLLRPCGPAAASPGRRSRSTQVGVRHPRTGGWWSTGRCTTSATSTRGIPGVPGSSAAMLGRMSRWGMSQAGDGWRGQRRQGHQGCGCNPDEDFRMALISWAHFRATRSMLWWLHTVRNLQVVLQQPCGNCSSHSPYLSKGISSKVLPQLNLEGKWRVVCSPKQFSRKVTAVIAHSPSDTWNEQNWKNQMASWYQAAGQLVCGQKNICSSPFLFDRYL